MKTVPRSMIVSAAVLLAASARAQDKPRPPLTADEISANKIQELQQERIATLKALTDVSTKLANSGRASVEEALEARLLLLQAEVDAASQEVDRVILYTDCVDALKDYEKLAAARKQAALGTEATTLKIKSRRLEIEILLEQARAREAKEGLLHRGQLRTMWIRESSKGEVVIPRRATLEDSGQRYVYVVGKDDMAHRREIVVQRELDDLFIVKQGLVVGDRIVVDGVRQVHDGEKVGPEKAGSAGDS